MFGQSLLSGAFGTALVPGENFGINLYTGTGANQTIGGKFKGAGSFNGTTDKVTLISPLGTAAGNENDNFSISMWVTWDSVSGSSGSLHGTLVGDYTGSNYGSFHIYTYSLGAGNGLSLGMERYFNSNGYYNSAWTTVGTISTLEADRWYNVTHTYVGSSKEVKLYLDGTLITTYTLDVTASGRTTNIYNVIGDYDNRGAYGHAGQIDQVRMFNTTLSSSQVSSLASETTATVNTLNFPAGAGCTLAYQFDTNFNTILSQDDLSTVNFPSGTTGAALYQFENSANGDAGPNPTSTANLTYVDGAFGKAVDFNGSNSVWQSTNQIIDAQQDFTISMWVRVEAYATSTYLWTSYATGDCGISMSGNAGSNYFSFHKYNNTQSPVYVSLDSPNTAILGKWYHLCGTFSTSTGMVFYIDGESVGTDSTTWVPQNHGAYSDSIGCYGYTPSGNRANFNGQIDQFRAYQQVLTAAQVLELAKGTPKYNGGSITADLNGWVNFKPDLTWIKDRDDTENHALFDANRGPNQWLHSNTTAAQTDYSGNYGLLSWENNGYTLGTGTAVNASGEKYVGWNWKAGDDNYSGYFNGTSTKITTDYTTNDSEFSVSVWAYPRVDPGSVYLYHANKGYYTNSSNTNYWSLQNYAAAAPTFIVRLNSTQVQATSSVSMVAGKWYHLVGTCDSSGNLKIYVNGTETGSASSAPARSMGQAIIFGQYMDGSWASGYYKGQMNQIRYFNQAISASEVTSLYNEGLSDNNTLDFPTGAGCTSAWPLNGSPDPLSGSSMGSTPVDLKFVKPGYTGKNNDGTIESQVTANPDYGFSIVKWVGSGTSGDTVGHGLTPASKSMLVIMKDLSASNDWMVMTNDLWSSPNQQYLKINTNAGVATSGADIYNVNNTTFKNDYRNTAGSSYVAYCWHSVPKYSKLGTYTGNGSATGPIVSTGFRPTWLMVKRADSTSWWNIQDDKRDPVNPRIHVLGANDSSAEINSSNYAIDFNDDGFQLLNSFGDWNASGGTYIYITFA